MFVLLICDLAEAAPAQVDRQLSVSWGRRTHFKSHFLSNWKGQTTQIRAHTGYRNLDMMFTCTIRNKLEYLIIPQSSLGHLIPDKHIEWESKYIRVCVWELKREQRERRREHAIRDGENNHRADPEKKTPRRTEGELGGGRMEGLQLWRSVSMLQVEHNLPHLLPKRAPILPLTLFFTHALLFTLMWLWPGALNQLPLEHQTHTHTHAHARSHSLHIHWSHITDTPGCPPSQGVIHTQKRGRQGKPRPPTNYAPLCEMMNSVSD